MLSLTNNYFLHEKQIFSPFYQKLNVGQVGNRTILPISEQVTVDTENHKITVH